MPYKCSPAKIPPLQLSPNHCCSMGSVGLLGEDYPGYFPMGDTRALAALLSRAERDPPFYAGLEEACRRRAPLFHPEREREAWAALLREVAAPGQSPR